MTYSFNHSLSQSRSYSQEILHKSYHHRSYSLHSADIFTLTIPKINDSLSSLICSICSLPMLKPMVLPCQHIFCFNCINNSKKVRSNSLLIYSTNSFVSCSNQKIIIKCRICLITHYLKSLSDLQENQSMKLLVNTLSCETCQQLYSSNQIDTCLYCFRVFCPKCYEIHTENHRNDLENGKNLYRILSIEKTININLQSNLNEKNQNSDNEILIIKSNNFAIKSTKQNLEKEDKVRNEVKINTKKKSNIIDLRQAIIKKSSSDKSSCRKNMSNDIKIDETIKIERTTIIPASQLSDRTIQQVKQRRIELERAVNKLIDVLIRKIDHNIHQISQYWRQIKSILLERYQLKTNRFQLINYLSKICCLTLKQTELYIEKNDEIKAQMDIVLRTLFIIQDQQSLSTIKQLFDREEQTTIRRLQRHLESLLSSYEEDLSFINSCIHNYESRIATYKNSNLNSIVENWIQITKHNYPSLIEKISNDFITTIPHIENILIQMLRNMKKYLLNIDARLENPTY